MRGSRSWTDCQKNVSGPRTGAGECMEMAERTQIISRQLQCVPRSVGVSDGHQHARRVIGQRDACAVWLHQDLLMLSVRARAARERAGLKARRRHFAV